MERVREQRQIEKCNTMTEQMHRTPRSTRILISPNALSYVRASPDVRRCILKELF